MKSKYTSVMWLKCKREDLLNKFARLLNVCTQPPSFLKHLGIVVGNLVGNDFSCKIRETLSYVVSRWPGGCPSPPAVHMVKWTDDQ